MPAAADLVGSLHSFQIPGSYSTTRGIDYRIAASDGASTTETPTYHVTVLAPTAILHAPIVSAPPAVPITIEALVSCSTTTCSATLAYRAPDSSLLGESTWTEASMSPSGPAQPVSDATAVQRYVAQIPADQVTTRGVDYFIRASDGETTAYSPGTAYVGTQVASVDGQGTHFFHVHVTEPIRIVHDPVVVAPWNEPISIRAIVNCQTASCTGSLSYRTTTSLNHSDGIVSYVIDGGPAWTEAPLQANVLEDLGGQGTVLEMTAEIPASAVTTDGVDYFLHVTDGETKAYYPGTSYVGGWGSADGIRAAWQHVEVPLRDSTREIAHAPQPVSRFRAPIPLRFAAYCTADHVCDATVSYRTTPVGEALGQVVFDASVWPTAPAQRIAVRPSRTGMNLYLFEASIPAAAVDTRGVDYLIRVSDGDRDTWWPSIPTATDLELAPLVAYHVSVAAATAIIHAPIPTAQADQPVTLQWRVICTADHPEECQTAAFHRQAPQGALTGGTPDVSVRLGEDNFLTFGDGDLGPPFTELATTVTITHLDGGTYALDAVATIPAAPAGTYDQYVLWAFEGNTNAYSPGTAYQGYLPVDGQSLGQVVPYTIHRTLP